jgi:hypothetical protein
MDDFLLFALVLPMYPFIGGIYVLHWKATRKTTCLVALHLKEHPEDAVIIGSAVGE